MRLLLSLLFALCTQCLSAQVSIILSSKEVKTNSETQITVVSENPVDIEFSVFSSTHLVITQEAHLSDKHTTFDVSFKDAPIGKYFILIKGKDLHEQGTIYVVE
ncbi:MAG: hypothetical protein RLZZ77_2245 [Bacteroidota bacterium]|jgi:hypothetical protein